MVVIFTTNMQHNLKLQKVVVIKNKNRRNFKINDLIAKFELDPIRDIKAKFLSGGQKKLLELI